jgi:PIN domain nuclease of toxin-antitoxin system
MSVDLLLDTHALLWLVADDPRHRDLLGDVLEQPASTVTVSAASYMEIAIRNTIGKLDIDIAKLRKRVMASGALELNVQPGHAEALAQLPLHHRDPFDRMLIAQALAEELTIVSVDTEFAKYEGLRIHGAA